MESIEFLGLDVGTKRTGVARGSSGAGLAEPLASIPTDQAYDKLADLVKDNKVNGIVVGLPRNLSGDDTDQTRWVRDWVVAAKDKLPVAFYWQDEALTTVKAQELAKQAKSADVDSLSAAIILQDFLDAPDAERVVC